MKNLNDINNEFQKALKFDDKSKCIQLCREAISKTTSKQFKQWSLFIFRLASFLIDENIEETINLYMQIVTVASKETHYKQLADSYLGLGYAFNERSIGDKDDNLEKSIFYYDQALSFYTKENYSYNWASIKKEIGLALLKKESGDIRKNLNTAIKNFEDTLCIFTKSKYPEERQDIVNKLRDLKKII